MAVDGDGETSAPPRRRKPEHPPYALMISEAIQSLNEVGGSSLESISRHIKAHNDQLPWAHDKLLPYYLNKLVLHGEFLSSNGHYRLPSEAAPPAQKLGPLLKTIAESQIHAVGGAADHRELPIIDDEAALVDKVQALAISCEADVAEPLQASSLKQQSREEKHAEAEPVKTVESDGHEEEVGTDDLVVEIRDLAMKVGAVVVEPLKASSPVRQSREEKVVERQYNVEGLAEADAIEIIERQSREEEVVETQNYVEGLAEADAIEIIERQSREEEVVETQNNEEEVVGEEEGEAEDDGPLAGYQGDLLVKVPAFERNVEAETLRASSPPKPAEPTARDTSKSTRKRRGRWPKGKKSEPVLVVLEGEAAVKRRGRPPKRKHEALAVEGTNEAQARDDSILKPVASWEVADGLKLMEYLDNGGQGSEPVKKKRKRLPKIKDVGRDDNVIKPVAIESSKEAEAHDDGVVKPVVCQEVVAGLKATENLDNIGEVSELVRKKRGRPPKMKGVGCDANVIKLVAIERTMEAEACVDSIVKPVSCEEVVDGLKPTENLDNGREGSEKVRKKQGRPPKMKAVSGDANVIKPIVIERTVESKAIDDSIVKPVSREEVVDGLKPTGNPDNGEEGSEQVRKKRGRPPKMKDVGGDANVIKPIAIEITTESEAIDDSIVKHVSGEEVVDGLKHTGNPDNGDERSEQVKKKRGRPPKIKDVGGDGNVIMPLAIERPKEAAARDDTIVKPVAHLEVVDWLKPTEDLDNGGEGPEQARKKRGRRPKINGVGRDDVVINPINIGSTEEADARDDNIVKPLACGEVVDGLNPSENLDNGGEWSKVRKRRGRRPNIKLYKLLAKKRLGRPPKRKLESLDSNKEAIVNNEIVAITSANCNDAGEAVELVTKKRMGKPPKGQLESSDITKEFGGHNGRVAKLLPKKRVGKPPKINHESMDILKEDMQLVPCEGLDGHPTKYHDTAGVANLAPKKKRGRPRKKEAKLICSTEEDISHIVVVAKPTGNCDGEQEGIKSVPEKRRGRPPKSNLEALDAIKEAQGHNDDVAEPKRRKGMPPKRKLDSLDSIEEAETYNDNVTKPTGNCDGFEDEGLVPKKRIRRPSKRKLELMDSTEEDMAHGGEGWPLISTELMLVNPKLDVPKPMGPEDGTLPEKGEESEPVTKRRGRPPMKKLELTISKDVEKLAVNKETSSSVLKRRGRPPKPKDVGLAH